MLESDDFTKNLNNYLDILQDGVVIQEELKKFTKTEQKTLKAILEIETHIPDLKKNSELIEYEFTYVIIFLVVLLISRL